MLRLRARLAPTLVLAVGLLGGLDAAARPEFGKRTGWLVTAVLHTRDRSRMLSRAGSSRVRATLRVPPPSAADVQRKRLTIAVELVANPSILFLE